MEESIKLIMNKFLKELALLGLFENMIFPMHRFIKVFYNGVSPITGIIFLSKGKEGRETYRAVVEWNVQAHVEL